MVDRFERFIFAISEISRYWHKIASDEMTKYGLKGPHAHYLVTMYRYSDGLTAARLCELCGKDKSDVSRVMSSMIKQGLVKRQGVNRNLYRAILRLTDKGKEAAEHVRERAAIAVEIAGRDLSDENRAVFYESLELIVSKLRDLSKDGLPVASELN